MGIDTTKGECLARLFARAHEGGVGKAPIVAVVVCNLHSVLGGIALERMLGINGFGRSQVCCHQIHKLQTREIVHKNSGILVVGPGKLPLCLSEETWLRGLQLVYGDAFSGLRGGENRMLGLLLSAPLEREGSVMEDRRGG